MHPFDSNICGKSSSRQPAFPLSQQGDQGEHILQLQRLLEQSGLRVGEDGFFGPATASAVRHFQSSRGISPSGVVGPDTWAALVSERESPFNSQLSSSPEISLHLQVSQKEISQSASPIDVSQKNTNTMTTSKVNGFKDFIKAVMFFDWDDTLCPSSDLAKRGLTLSSIDDLRLPGSNISRTLDCFEQVLIPFITSSKQLADICIVTNAELGWVELSARKFFPRLVPFLIDVPIFSARHFFEKTHPNQPTQWKVMFSIRPLFFFFFFFFFNNIFMISLFFNCTG